MQSTLVLVLSANKYDFKDSKDGRQVAGTTVQYVNLSVDPNPSKGPVGYVPMKSSLPASHVDLAAVPGYYNASFEIGQYNGKPELKLVGLQLVGRADLLPKPEGK